MISVQNSFYLRAIVAAAVAATVLVATFTTGFMVIGYLESTMKDVWTMAGVVHGTTFIFFFGWPIAFVTILSVATLGLFIYKTPARAKLFWQVSVAGILGGVTIPIVWSVVWGNKGDFAMMSALGVLCGGAAGATFASALGYAGKPAREDSVRADPSRPG